MLSIVIPALNEEKYLPLLLESIKRQSFFDYEIILADAGSKDKTIEIAKKYNCVIVGGGLPANGTLVGWHPVSAYSGRRALLRVRRRTAPPGHQMAAAR